MKLESLHKASSQLNGNIDRLFSTPLETFALSNFKVTDLLNGEVVRQ